MKTTFLAILIAAMAATSLAGVSARVYRADEITPLPWADPNIPNVYQDIMVGTRLTIFIESDAPDSLWDGGLCISDEDWIKGFFSGRGYNAMEETYDGSILPAAGELSSAMILLGEAERYFFLSVTHGIIGEWGIVDYRAQAVGKCDVGVYEIGAAGPLPDDFNPDFDDPPPAQAHWLQGLTFHHVLSRDYNDDAAVDFADFALLASQWQGEAPVDPNATASFDLDGDEAVDVADLALFCDYWLERTDIVDPNSDPNAPELEP